MRPDEHLGFPKTLVSILVAVTYLSTFLGVLVRDQVTQIPQDTGGLDIDQAYIDLQKIASQPRPYASHANDRVRSYLLSRLRNITNGFDFITVEEDLSSTASWFSPSGGGIVFEGTNILVKVEGLDPQFEDKGGVLFSAHFDSVSTAPGVIDDGIGTVTLVHFVEYLTVSRPRRTAIFNINNGEEDGLRGAHAYLEHPWANIPDTFLNLEGAGNGGRPLLFRATSMTPVLSFADNAQVPHPHANVLSADAFSRGVIRSGTDFTVYSYGLGNGTLALEGIDFAFYQGRSLYHTPGDRLRDSTNRGSKEALWTMMETVKGAGWMLLNEDETHAAANDPVQAPVYFDLFGSSLAVFTQRSLFAFNVSLLVLGPLFVTCFYFLRQIREKILAIQLASRRRSGSSRPESSILSDVLVASLREQLQASTPPLWSPRRWGKRISPFSFRQTIWPWARFWVAFIIATCLEAALVALILRVNPNVAYSSPLTVLASFLGLAYLGIVLTHRISITSSNHAQQKVTTSIQLYIFSWALLVIATVGLNTLQIGGTYFVTGWSFSVFLGSFLAVSENVLRSPPQRKKYLSPLTFPIEDDAHIPDGSVLPPDEVAEPLLDDEDSTEQTPFLRRLSQLEREAHIRETHHVESAKWWSAQFLLTVLVPLILVSHVLCLFTTSLSQTFSEGSPPVVLYGGTAILSLLVFIPIAPFTFRISRMLDLVVFIIFLATTIHNCTVFPFNETAPLKVFFLQRIELDLTAPGGRNQIVHAVSSLAGLPQYVGEMVVPLLPSAQNRTVNCTFTGIDVCEWESDLLPSHGNAIGIQDVNSNSLDDTPWLQVTTQRLSSTSAIFSVQGTNTRGCTLHFDSQRISSFYLDNSARIDADKPREMIVQPGYPMPLEGIRILDLRSRTWDRNFTVEFEWEEDVDEGGFEGRVACVWAEYESGMRSGPGGDSGARIPALEELFISLPNWLTVSKQGEGLVEAWAKFAI